jgi:Tetratricopeptide repeat
MSPAEKAYSDGFYGQAEQLYTQALAQQPHDAVAAARLIETLLHQGKSTEAAVQLTTALAANPNSAAVLTAQAEVQFRQGQPWQAARSLDQAATADPCYARIHLVRSQIFRIDSMYASERAEMQKAYDLDITDPDILMAWSRIMPAAQEAEGTAKARDTMKDLDAETRAKAQTSLQSMIPLLHEDTQTCKGLPSVPSASIPLLPTRDDGKHIDGFQIEVRFPKGPAKLQLDTATSGIYITRALADFNGFQRSMEAPIGTVQAESVAIGPLEFHDCMAGVSETPFPGKADGFIGTDLLSSYLITIDGRDQKLKLDPLPARPDVLPGDRIGADELAGFEPVYHRRHYLLVPITIDNKVRKLFALDTGMRMSAMNPETAHAVSDIKVNFTNPLSTKSGPAARVYRDSFGFQFGDLTWDRQSGSVLEFETSTMTHNAGFDVGGMLGFDVLGSLTMRLDYRDGLIKLEAPESVASSKGHDKKAGSLESARTECPTFDTAEVPVNQTLELKITGTLDSGHLKPGQNIYAEVMHGLIYPDCTLNMKSMVYGHVTAVSSKRNPDTAELGLVFDRGDCAGKSNQPLNLHVIAILSPPDFGAGSLHGSIPVEVHGARQISDAVASTTGYDARLSVNGKPAAVHPGSVVGLPQMKLEPLGGPACSARIISSTRSVQLGTGAELLLTLSGNSTAPANP